MAPYYLDHLSPAQDIPRVCLHPIHRILNSSNKHSARWNLHTVRNRKVPLDAYIHLVCVEFVVPSR